MQMVDTFAIVALAVGQIALALSQLSVRRAIVRGAGLAVDLAQKHQDELHARLDGMSLNAGQTHAAVVAAHTQIAAVAAGMPKKRTRKAKAEQ